MLAMLLGAPAHADTSHLQHEDGYQLWLRYKPLPPPARQQLQRRATSIVQLQAETPTLRAARDELQRGLGSMLGQAPALGNTPRAGSVVLARAASLPADAQIQSRLRALGAEGY